MKILIVEDELLIAHASKSHLEGQGFTVIGMATDEKGFKDSLSKDPDVILMDVTLKNGGNGIDLVNKLRESGDFTPVIFTTGNSRSKTLEEIEDIEKSCLVSKPVVFQELMNKIQDCYKTMKNKEGGQG